jgi:hypothetical protein
VEERRASITAAVIQLLSAHNNPNSSGTDAKLLEDSLYALKSLCTASPSSDMYKQAGAVFHHFATQMAGDQFTQVRCRSMAALHHLALSSPALFKSTILGFFVEMASSGSGGLRGQRELRSWIETTLYMAIQPVCGEGEAEERMALFKAVFVPLVAQVQRLPLDLDWHSFALYIGHPFFASGTGTTTSTTGDHNRLLLVNTITLLQTTTKAIREDLVGGGGGLNEDARSVLLHLFTPCALRLAALLNEVQGQSVTHQKYTLLYGDSTTDRDQDDTDDEQQLVVYFRNWLSHARTVCTIIIGNLCSLLSATNMDVSALAGSFACLSNADRVILIKNAVAPFAKACGSVQQCFLVESVVRQGARVILDGSSQPQDASNGFAGCYTWLICDVLKDRVYLYPELLQCAISFIHVNYNPGEPCTTKANEYGGKWCHFLANLLATKKTTSSCDEMVFNDLLVAVIASLRSNNSIQNQLCALLYELIMSAGESKHQQSVTAHLQTKAGLSPSTLDQIIHKPKPQALHLLTSTLHPLIAHSRPVSSTVIKKLVPEKLLIWSKLRREGEREERENDALAGAAELLR